MIQFKTLTVEELKKDYIDRHGFVFKGGIRSSDKAIEHLCNTLVQHKITTELPEFVVRLDDTLTAFIYNQVFDGPTFFKHAMVATQMGMCQIESLHLFLKNQK
jgi:uncharacterized circularly permuted ATP-grasp superfamily protein